MEIQAERGHKKVNNDDDKLWNVKYCHYSNYWTMYLYIIFDLNATTTIVCYLISLNTVVYFALSVEVMKELTWAFSQVITLVVGSWHIVILNLYWLYSQMTVTFASDYAL